MDIQLQISYHQGIHFLYTCESMKKKEGEKGGRTGENLFSSLVLQDIERKFRWGWAAL